VRVLFDGKLGASGSPAKRARDITNRYTKYYNHVIPFDEGVLEEAWNRCRGPSCAAGRHAVEQMLGMQAGGSGTFPAMKHGDETRYPASPLDSSPTKLDLSPEPEFD
jgi:hypothetical protein